MYGFPSASVGDLLASSSRSNSDPDFTYAANARNSTLSPGPRPFSIAQQPIAASSCLAPLMTVDSNRFRRSAIAHVVTRVTTTAAKRLIKTHFIRDARRTRQHT